MDLSQEAVHLWESSIRDHDDRASMYSVHACNGPLPVVFVVGHEQSSDFLN